MDRGVGEPRSVLERVPVATDCRSFSKAGVRRSADTAVCCLIDPDRILISIVCEVLERERACVCVCVCVCVCE